ncbi:DUF1028 domain-containing protein [Acaricomes phytoseiuli]|uniref:DUF1028 domain-containing protein n=1 Tax=Acaricomes phytoseiuli TaxID=291968 RepID=UPI000376BDBB|nr:DUF1028 domain-containing protein [Acaricomes phytoseiuli]MCW1249281.1 DUF1028 domain-containing protein [Acaricomes phytoseiuli]
MTFSLVATDASGALGSAVCSSSQAVAARCIHLADHLGAVNSQNITDPRLGPMLLELLDSGATAAQALTELVETTEYMEFRQLLVVDAAGRAAAFSGERSLGVFGDAIGDGVAAGGNLLADPDIPQRMIEAFEGATGDLELRLLAAMRAAQAAGGEAGPVHSAGLAVVREAGWRVTDLRVDWTNADPVDELTAVLTRWLPQRDDYVDRGLHPAKAPAYGVPGDD